MVKELREKTGAGMMDCKTALTETNGDMEAAIDWLRTKGISKADKKAGRTAAEGLIGVDSGVREAVVVEVNSETDFVARNDAFQEIVRQCGQGRAGTDGTTEAVAAAKYPGSDKSVADTIKDAIGTIGENMSFRRSAKLSVEHGAVATYVHNAVADGLGKLGVLVAIEIDRRRSCCRRVRPPGGDACRRDQPAGAQRRGCRSRGGRAREGDLLRAGARVGQAGKHHRKDGRGPACASSTRKSCS